MDDKPNLFSSRYLGRSGKAQDNIKAKDYFSISRSCDNILWTRVARTRCLFLMGITLRLLAPFTWNKSKNETVCLVIKVVKSSFINE